MRVIKYKNTKTITKERKKENAKQRRSAALIYLKRFQSICRRPHTPLCPLWLKRLLAYNSLFEIFSGPHLFYSDYLNIKDFG